MATSATQFLDQITAILNSEIQHSTNLNQFKEILTTPFKYVKTFLRWQRDHRGAFSIIPGTGKPTLVDGDTADLASYIFRAASDMEDPLNSNPYKCINLAFYYIILCMMLDKLYSKLIDTQFMITDCKDVEFGIPKALNNNYRNVNTNTDKCSFTLYSSGAAGQTVGAFTQKIKIEIVLLNSISQYPDKWYGLQYLLNTIPITVKAENGNRKFKLKTTLSQNLLETIIECVKNL